MEYSLDNFNVMLNNLYTNLSKEKDDKLILPNLVVNITTTNTFFKNAKEIGRASCRERV